MTKYVPIWLEDEDRHPYHVKVDGDGYAYIVDKCLNKSVRFGRKDMSNLTVGSVFDGTALCYGRYTVVRNDLEGVRY